MRALAQVADWPVPTAAAAVTTADGSVHTIGPIDTSFRIASLSKMLTGWAILIACEEGILDLDQPAGQPGCTLRHLLSHAGGYGFDGPTPIAKPGTRRIYSNTGIELAAQALADAAEMPVADYLHGAVLVPLGMSATRLNGSAAHAVDSTVRDLVAFIAELRTPSLISAASAADFHTVQFPELAGIVPGLGRFDPCPWGLGTEIKGAKSPHWTGTRNSPGTFGHFGGAGTLLWVDPGVHIACVALTDRPFDEWSARALVSWPTLADAILQEVGA